LRFGRRRVLRWVAIEMIIATGLAAVVSAWSGRLKVIIAAGVIAVLQTLYNLEPIRLKRKGFLGVAAFCAAVVVLPFLLSYYAIRDSVDTSVWPILVGIGILAIGRMTWLSVPDRAADTATGMRTPAVRHGVARTLAASTVIMLVGLAMAGWGLWWRFGPGWAIPAVATHGSALVVLHTTTIPSAMSAHRRAMPLVALGELALVITPLVAGSGFAGETGVHRPAFRIETDIVNGIRTPQRHRNDARFDQREPGEELRELLLAAQVHNGPLPEIHLVEHRKRIQQIIVLAEMRQGEIATRAHRVPVPGDHRPWPIAVRDMQQGLDHQYRNRFPQVKLPGQLGSGQDLVRLPHVLSQVGDIVDSGNDISAVVNQAVIDVDIHHPRVRLDWQRDFVYVAHGRYPGSEIQELPHAMGEQVTHHPSEQGTLSTHKIGDMRCAHGRVIGELTVYVAVMRPVQPVVAYTRDVGLYHAPLASHLDRNVTSYNAIHPVDAKA
jgi:4-hydroxybenzoate polyprenyltransferase